VSRDSKIKVGIAGIGFGQAVLAPAFALQPCCEVKAICASSEERARAVAQKLGIENAYGDWRRLCDDPQLNALAIATPPPLQPEIAIAAFNAGKAVFCEKPLATSLRHALAMVKAARISGRANMVDFEFPEIPAWQQARLLLQQGALGRIRQATVNWSVETYAIAKRIVSWKTQREEGGGIMYLFVSHVLHYVEFLLGSIHQLSCRMFPTASASDALGETFVTLSVVAGSGVPVAVSVSTAAFLGSGHSLEIYGDEGTLILRNPTSDYISGFQLFFAARGAKQLEQISGSPPLPGEALSDGRIQAVGKLAGRFLDWIESGKPACPSFRQGLRVQALLELAYESHMERKWVNCEQRDEQL